MDPVMYIASSQLDRPEGHHRDAIEEFYRAHGHLPVWVRTAALAAAVYRGLGVLRHQKSRKVHRIGPADARMIG